MDPTPVELLRVMFDFLSIFGPVCLAHLNTHAGTASPLFLRVPKSETLCRDRNLQPKLFKYTIDGDTNRSQFLSFCQDQCIQARPTEGQA
jgi:hypothetical protein